MFGWFVIVLLRSLLLCLVFNLIVCVVLFGCLCWCFLGVVVWLGGCVSVVVCLLVLLCLGNVWLCYLIRFD